MGQLKFHSYCGEKCSSTSFKIQIFFNRKSDIKCEYMKFSEETWAVKSTKYFPCYWERYRYFLKQCNPTWMVHLTTIIEYLTLEPFSAWISAPLGIFEQHSEEVCYQVCLWPAALGQNPSDSEQNQVYHSEKKNGIFITSWSNIKKKTISF